MDLQFPVSQRYATTQPTRNRNRLDVARSLVRGVTDDLPEDPTREQLLAAQRGLEGALTFLGHYIREAQ